MPGVEHLGLNVSIMMSQTLPLVSQIESFLSKLGRETYLKSVFLDIRSPREAGKVTTLSSSSLSQQPLDPTIQRRSKETPFPHILTKTIVPQEPVRLVPLYQRSHFHYIGRREKKNMPSPGSHSIYITYPTLLTSPITLNVSSSGVPLPCTSHS